MSELGQLEQAVQKAVQSTSNQANAMAITYNDEIRMKTFEKAPFLTFLESRGRCTDVDTANVAFFKEAPTNTAAFIAETANIPDYAATTYTEVADRMKTIASGIKVSLMAQMGTDAVDLLQREIMRGYINIQNLTDKTLLEGDSSNSSNQFDSIFSDSDVNTDDLQGEETTLDDIDDMLTTIVDEKGGAPDCIITDHFVAKQLRALVAPYRRYNDKVDIGLGYRVTTYEGTNGKEIPILIDPNLGYNESDDEHKLCFVDSSAIDVKYLMRPSLIDNLQAANLAYNQAVATFVTAMNVAPYTAGVIDGIGSGNE